MIGKFAISAVGPAFLAWAGPAVACSSPVFVVDARGVDDGQAVTMVRATFEQALIFDDATEARRIVSYRLRILEDNAAFKAGQVVELIAPDSGVIEGCLQFFDPDAIGQDGLLRGYVRLASKDDRGDFYVSRMASRRNVYLRNTYPLRGEWKSVRFTPATVES